MTENERYYLYVVGEASPDPDTWSIWSEYALVIARTPDEARQIVSMGVDTVVTEIPLVRALLLAQMTEPALGDDL